MSTLARSLRNDFSKKFSAAPGLDRESKIFDQPVRDPERKNHPSGFRSGESLMIFKYYI